MKRADFLARVSGALGKDRPSRLGNPPNPLELPEGWKPEGLVETFQLELEAVGGNFYAAPTIAKAATLIEEIVRRSGACTFVRSRDRFLGPLLSSLSITEAEETAEADIGITGALYGVAGTGSIVLSSEAGRLVSLLPLRHLAVLSESQLVPSIAVALSKQYAALPSGIFFATGPSRTADIEMTLSTGVHGPGEVHVVLVAEDFE